MTLSVFMLLIIAGSQIIILIKVMDKMVRYRKAFYQKENDLHNNNKKPSHPKGGTLKPYLSLQPLTTHKPHKQTLPPPATLTSLYLSQYGPQLLNHEQCQVRPPLFLSNHQIDAGLRARMLDWMVEVTSSYKFKDKTYFDGIQIMDRYFGRQLQSIGAQQLHVIGVQAMMIASKMEEVYPLKLSTVYHKIGHKKISQNQLVQTEATIIQTLDYKLNSWTVFDLACLKICHYVNQPEQVVRNLLGEIFQQNVREDNVKSREEQGLKLQDICAFWCKLVFYDYNFYCEHTMLVLAQTVLSAAFDCLHLHPPPSFWSCSPIIVELCKQKLLNIAKNYKSRFPGLNNVFKFAKKEILEAVAQVLIL